MASSWKNTPPRWGGQLKRSNVLYYPALFRATNLIKRYETFPHKMFYLLIFDDKTFPEGEGDMC